LSSAIFARCPFTFFVKKRRKKNESGERLQALINALHALIQKCQEDAR
jgi:hypothetical protein